MSPKDLIKKMQFKFKWAFNGLRFSMLHDTSVKIILGLALLTVIGGLLLPFTITEWFVVLGFIALVVSLELINSALEQLCDLVDGEYHPRIKQIKDISAGAVLWASLLALLVGIIIIVQRI